MKFKVEPKDFLLFCIYCVLLLYLCAIAVLNVATLAQEGRFDKPNPRAIKVRTK